MRGSVWTAICIAAVVCGAARTGSAQEKRAPILEVVVGRSGFIDEAWDYFTTIGVGMRWFVTPRLAVGPEVAYLNGESDALEASSLTVTLNLTFDFFRDDGDRRVAPYLVAAGGYLRQRTLVGRGPGAPGLVPFISSEGTASAGFGARIALGSRFFIAPEFRLGWEPETRIAVNPGVRLR